MQEYDDREYWVKFPYGGKEYTVGADLYGQGSWRFVSSGEVIPEDNPGFFRYVAYVNGKSAIVTPKVAAIADLVITELYWNSEE